MLLLFGETLVIHRFRERLRERETQSHSFSPYFDEIRNSLEQALEDTQNVNKETLNNLCSKIGNIFLDSKSKSFQSREVLSDGTKNKKWFGPQCQSARRKYHLARRINQINPSQTNKQKLKEASLSYKRTMNFHIKQFNRKNPRKITIT